MGIAVITPCFDNIEALSQTLGSICNLKPRINTTLEIVVVDGSKAPLMSGERGQEMMSILKSAGISFRYLHGRDEGPYDAMNKGIDCIESSNSWIWFLNSGDLAHSLPTLESMESDKEIIIGCWQGMRSNSKRIRPSTGHGLSMGRSSEIGNGLCHQAMLFNHNAYSHKHYAFTQYKYAAELDYYIDSIINSRYLLDEEFFVAYDNRTGISQARADLHFREMLEIYSERGLAISNTRKIKGLARSYLVSAAHKFVRIGHG